MDAILKCKIVEEEEKNDKITFDINSSLSLIKKTSYYFGEKYDIEVSLDSISMKKLQNNTYLWETFCSDMLKSIKLNRKLRDDNSDKY